LLFYLGPLRLKSPVCTKKEKADSTTEVKENAEIANTGGGDPARVVRAKYPGKGKGKGKNKRS